MSQQNTIEFESVKANIINAMEKLDFKKYGIDEPVSLIDGFITQPLNMQITNSLIIGGSVVPMVMLLGKESGRIYFFAVKALIDIPE